jgi:multiple sugar transport system substrate-binding protein
LTTYSWVPDWVAAGGITPIDSWVEQHLTEEDLADIEEVHRLYLTNYAGQMWGLPVDGDAFILYYRKDLFEDESYRAAFKEQYGRELAPPTTFEEYAQVAEFFNTFTKGDVLGFAEQRDAGSTFFWFLQFYQSVGGRLFDPETMRPLLNEPLAVETVQWMLEMQDYGAPGNGSWSFPEVWGNFLTGHLAMAITWPPLGRFAEAASGLSNYPTWLPQTAVAGKVGYAPAPNGRSQLASNYIWTINAHSQNQEAAFAFMMWWSSPELATTISLLPNSLGDPLRYSQYNSPVYRTHWPGAGDYLDTLLAGARCGIPDIKMPGGGEYQETLGRALAQVWTAAATPQAAMDQATAEWEKITDRLGRDRQREAYLDLLNLMEPAEKSCQSQ